MELRAAPIEFVLIAVAFVGTVVNVLLLRTAVAAQLRLRHDDTATEPEHIIAAASCRQESLRLGKQMMMLMGGCTIVFLSPPPPELREVPQTVVTISVLIGVSIVMTITSMFERWAQRDVARATIRGASKTDAIAALAADVAEKSTKAVSALHEAILANGKVVTANMTATVDTKAAQMGEVVQASAESVERAVQENTTETGKINDRLDQLVKDHDQS